MVKIINHSPSEIFLHVENHNDLSLLKNRSFPIYLALLLVNNAFFVSSIYLLTPLFGMVLTYYLLPNKPLRQWTEDVLISKNQYLLIV